MKIRTGFVSNSSSSSFILAFKKDVTRKDVLEVVKKNISQVEEYAENSNIQNIAWDLDVDAEELNVTNKEIVNMLVEKIADELYSQVTEHGIELDNWICFSRECGQDTGLLGVFMYYHSPNLNTEKIKIMSTWS